MHRFLVYGSWYMVVGIFIFTGNVLKSCGNALDNLRKACRIVAQKDIRNVESYYMKSLTMCKKAIISTFIPQLLPTVFHIKKMQFQSVDSDFSALSTAPITTTTNLKRFKG